MSIEEKETENLFSYGTLQTEATQLATSGRRLEGKPDVLVGYSLMMIPIQDQNIEAMSGATHYRNVQFTGNTSDRIEGTVFAVTTEELAQADVYEEVAAYKRVLAQLESGTNAWVYLHSPQ